MTAQNLSAFMTPLFIKRTAETLLDIGFVSDEHDFAPYRETISHHMAAIREALRKEGHEFNLLTGFIKHEATYAYYIYDQDRFSEPSDAKQAISDWLDRKYNQ